MSYQIDQDALLQIINSSGLEEVDRDILRKTITELRAYQEQQLKSIEKKILSPKGAQKIGEIAVALAPVRKEPYPGLAEIGSIGFLGASDSVCGNTCFLEAGYEDQQQFTSSLDQEKLYRGTYRLGDTETSFQYRLRFDGRFLKAQELLYRLALLYPVENAVLWAPHLRKAVSVLPVDKIPEKADINFHFKDNNLPIQEKRCSLLWNLRVEHLGACKAVGKVPYGRDVKYTFHFPKNKNGGWRFPLPEDIDKSKRVIVHDVSFSDEGIVLTLNQELAEFTIVEQQAVAWGHTDIMQLDRDHRIWTNRVEKNVLSARRILSRGDMEFAIQPFRNANGFRCALAGELEQVCTRYARKYQCRQESRIWYPQSQHKKAKGKLKFSTEGPARFYDDYINYVLLYLEYYYPEIEWVGGK